MPRILFILCCLNLLGGCASVISSATSGLADNISQAILNQNDPATVRDGAPAYLLMIDGLIDGDPENDALLLAGAKLYGSYATAFIEDPERARRLANRSLDYARRALCQRDEILCTASAERLPEFEAILVRADRRDLPALYAFAVAWAGWIQVNSEDWNAIAELPKVTASFERCLALDETHDRGGAHLYLGVIHALRPAALGGKPDLSRQHFERAIELSNDENLMARVLMAQHYARIVFDRELHDELLTSVREETAEYPGYVLSNALARDQAEKLLAESDEFF